jgi:hypothetical protein
MLGNLDLLAFKKLWEVWDWEVCIYIQWERRQMRDISAVITDVMITRSLKGCLVITRVNANYHVISVLWFRDSVVLYSMLFVYKRNCMTKSWKN